MCGIVGYTGPREAGPILIEGLARLEYRGYDSAGIALVDDGGDLFVEKKAGKLANLRAAIADRTPHAAIGLAHTRWATHGRPNDLNAHPHQDCTGEITVIHNGIIENFRELRDGLEARGHRLASETDTEALAHLVEEAYQGDLADAVRATLRQVQGAYAIAVMHRAEGDRLVGARKDVPLVVGLAEGESFLASDVAAILAHTDRVIFLEDGDVADLHPTGVTITDVDGRPQERTVTVIDWSPEAAEKGGYEHFMLKEIHEQPESLRQAITGRVTRENHIWLEELEGFAETLATIDRIELIACGTAYYASLIGAAAIQDWIGIPARATVGSEFRYSPPPIDERTLVIAVTQSGETADTIAPTRLARERGAPVIAVTNTVGSAITREAHRVLFLQAGPEIAVAASKTFVAQVTTLVILAAAIAKARGALGLEQEQELGAALHALPDGAAKALENASGIRDLARRYVNSRGFMFVGRGYTYPTALEGALKLKEVSYVHAEGYAAGEMKHGPISLLDAECPLVAVATRSSVYDKLVSNVMEGRARDARVIAVATEGDPQIERFADVI
ncbi:MAG TPA: glutamine--fructose-6-phosphate transaminase (isomerizing), partial [Patescibacteria group bacterium]|nr:glutamine--fructose-6-phosphate transaminase (isomerizing) [Patescibacteria group bacterium]